MKLLELETLNRLNEHHLDSDEEESWNEDMGGKARVIRNLEPGEKITRMIKHLNLDFEKRARIYAGVIMGLQNVGLDIGRRNSEYGFFIIENDMLVFYRRER